MIREVVKQRTPLVELCRRFRVRRLQLFGSAATGAFLPEASDLDFLAEFADTQNSDYADRYYDFAIAVEKLFDRPVDILTERSIRNPYFRAEIERTAEKIYEAPAQETLA